MSKTDLQNWLLGNSGFQARFQNLVVDSVSSQFAKLRRSVDQVAEHDWDYLLVCASLLAQSHDSPCQDAALRIAQFCLQKGVQNRTYRDAAAVVLDSLANQPAIILAHNQHLLEEGVQDRLPFTLLLDWVRRSIENTVTLSDSSTITVNHFQRRFWQEIHCRDWLSISAPTSAGKSYVIGRWLAEYYREAPRATIVYLVPTRALIQQVQQDIQHLLKQAAIRDVNVTALPLLASIHESKGNVLVFTQERFHILLGQCGSDLRLDVLIVDEAQKVGDNYRGVLLQQAIEAAVFQNPQCRVIFASPMTENPGVLLEDAPQGVSRTDIVGDDTVVNQNLIWVSQVRGRPDVWDVELILDSAPVTLGRVEMPDRPSPDSKRLPFVAYTLASPTGGNVIYVNGAAHAEKTAKQVYDLLGENAEVAGDADIRDLVELIKKTVHRSYSLAQVLSRGIAFHYGNMPLLIRTEIERLFRANKIKYLICTSTLIEGVNMPCKSIFVRGPTKGQGKPMSADDFWNLAGRAGRWGQEFQGNVVCVDARRTNVWANGAPTGKAKFRITRTCDEVLGEMDSLVDFIERGTPRNEALRNPNLEYVFSYLMSCYIRNGSITQAAWARRFAETVVQRVEAVISLKAEELRTPKEVVLRNPGISPMAMDGLLEYFEDRKRVQDKPVEDLLPVPPESEDAVEEYTKLLNRINKYLGDVFGRAGRVWQLALLIVDWMRGYPLARVIASRARYYGNDDIAGLIRSAMNDVEQFARFQAPKFLACYVDLLRTYLERIERQDLVERLFELNVLLEFGVSQKTQLSLIGLGLSRSSAIMLSELIADGSLDEQGCLAWLTENDWMTADMPALIRREIATLINKNVD